MTFTLRTEVSRGSADIYPSHLEIYFKHFEDNIYYTHHTGITDRYSPHLYDEEEENVEEELSSEGIEYLQREVDGLYKCIDGIDEFKSSERIEYHYVNHEANIFIASVVFADVKTLIQIRISPSRRRTLTAFTIHSDSYERAGVDKLIEYAKQFIAPTPSKKDKIHIITQSNNDFYLKDIPLKHGKRSQFSYDHYNEDFEEISERIIKTLTTDSESGIVLFHGDPGTGKTSYLKHLIHTIPNKKLIYMPPDLTEHISSPGFITFMMGEATNSVLLIEDAENVLRHREAGGNQAVSNILNISDGILGDVLKLQIVCTFNSKLEEIDPALRRPGRCIAEYRFENLAASRASSLMAKVHGEDINWTPKDSTLAEVFNFKKPHDVSKDKRRTVGFV